MKYILAILLCTIGASFAGYFLKRASAAKIIEIIKNKFLYIGAGLYLCTSLMTVWLLQKISYTTVISAGALSFVWTLIISNKLLGERITKRKIIGIFFIIAGVYLIASN